MADRTLSTDDIWSQISGERICMFSTHDGSVIRSRPMAPMANQDDGVIWFITDRDSHKTHDLADDSPVTLTFQNAASNWFVTMIGSASVVDDKDKLKELWSDALKNWFDGPNDPRAVLLAFEPGEADYWNGPNRILAGLKMLVTKATGMKTDLGDAGKVAM